MNTQMRGKIFDINFFLVFWYVLYNIYYILLYNVYYTDTIRYNILNQRESSRIDHKSIESKKKIRFQIAWFPHAEVVGDSKIIFAGLYVKRSV